MKDSSAIFISIGDTIKSNVRKNSTSKMQIMLDQVFGGKNYIATLVRKSGIAPRQDIKHIANSQDLNLKIDILRKEVILL